MGISTSAGRSRRTATRPAAAVATLMLLAVPAMPAHAAGSAAWVPTLPMGAERFDHTATLLASGRVLVAGGLVTDPVTGANNRSASAQLYDPSTNSWSATGSMLSPGVSHTSVRLGNGEVLDVGSDGSGSSTASELYDPATGTWSDAGVPGTWRAGQTETLLDNGKVLVAGGGEDCSHTSCTTNTPLSSAALYDPATGTWSATGSMAQGRTNHTATLLKNGEVLVAGGWGCDTSCHALASAELYDPAAGTWTATGSLGTARQQFIASVLPRGDVLAAGGRNDTSVGYLSSAEVYHPASGTWSSAGTMPTTRDENPGTATLLPDGQVLAVGGLASPLLYDPGSRTWSTTANTLQFVIGNTATLLPDGEVLVAGGAGSNDATENLPDAELYLSGS